MNGRSPHILVVDDDREIRRLVARFLSDNGLRVTAAGNAEEADTALAAGRFDLVVLDLMLPGEDGISIARRLRRTGDLPILMLTARGGETDRIVGLEIGADDYVTKPFSPRELLARIRAVLRRTGERTADAPKVPVFRFAGWAVDVQRRELRRPDGALVPTTDAEFDLLTAFVERPQRVLSREQLLDLARGRQAQLFDRSIDVAVMRLRRKIEPDPAKPEIIRTVRNGGYMFALDVKRRRDRTRAPRWLGGIAARIAAISIGGLVLAQLASVGIALLLRPSELQVFQARWLVETLAEAARETMLAAPERREAALRARPEAEFLALEWRRDHAVSDDQRQRRGGSSGRLQRGLGERLPPGFRAEVDFTFPPRGSLGAPDRHIRRVPPDDAVWSESVGGAVPGTFTIAIRLPDASWLVARAHRTHLEWAWAVFAAWLVGMALVGAFAAWWAAHRLARPLEALAGEAARAGAGLDAAFAAPRNAPNEVRTIGDALARMRGQLVRHVEDRTRLLAAISHDLRTPLTRLRLRAEGIGEESERLKAFADLAEMERMIAETLDFARADALAAKPERFDLAALVETIVDERADLGRAVRYEGPASLVIEGRAGAIKRAVANLIDNALVYAGSAEVRLDAGAEAIAILVADEGPGIPADRIEDMFRPFVRLEDSRSRETGGAGLGLAVVRDIARAHGGDATLRNRQDRGLEAVLSLPRIA